MPAGRVQWTKGSRLERTVRSRVCRKRPTGAVLILSARQGRRIVSRLPPTLLCRLRILKYGPGGFFRPHYDGSFVRGPEFGAREFERSLLTFFLFLNDEYEGGRTTLLSPVNKNDRLEIEPQPGKLLVTQHDVLHEGARVLSGEKWALRTGELASACAFTCVSRHSCRGWRVRPRAHGP